MFKIGAIVFGLILGGIAWAAVSMTTGCPPPSAGYSDDGDDDNVRSGSRGHSRGYYHGGKY